MLEAHIFTYKTTVYNMFHYKQLSNLNHYLRFIIIKKMNKKLTMQRLMKEEKSLDNQPIPNAIVTREGLFNFHFCLYDLEGPYKGGLYHGLFELHENYPFNAPKLFFYTPNGRFEVNIPICTSFTNYHQETWTSAWNVRSLILATISFMYSQEPSYGCRSDPESIRMTLAKQSKRNNLKNPDFVKFFVQKLLQLSKISREDLHSKQSIVIQEPYQHIQQDFPFPQAIEDEQNHNFLIDQQIKIHEQMNEELQPNLINLPEALMEKNKQRQQKQQVRRKRKSFYIKLGCYMIVIGSCYLVYKYI